MKSKKIHTGLFVSLTSLQIQAGPDGKVTKIINDVRLILPSQAVRQARRR